MAYAKLGFDLGEPATYYTRPMLPPGSKPLDVDRLADGGADVDFAVPLAELPGLRSLRAGVAGSVHGHVHFAREQGVAVAELVLKGTATLECQRCMKPMEYALESAARVALIATEAQAGELPPDLEPMLAEGGRISIAGLITEELLLTLPIVPLHEGDEACASAPAEAVPERGGETHRPFARLAELLKR
jgi:uncharacterized protein